MKSFPIIKQVDAKDCGPTCIRIVAKYYKKSIPISELRALTETTRAGSTLLNLSKASEKIGLRSLGVKFSLNNLKDAVLPCILHWNIIKQQIIHRFCH